MSESAIINSPVEIESVDFLDKVIESGNICSITLSDLESEEFRRAQESNALKVGAEIVARFWSKVNRNGALSSYGRCWEWTASRICGYGQFTLPRDLYGIQPHVYAHRFAYELTFGAIGSTAIKACHRCDNRRCVRPSHLFLGTQGDNLNDARRKGRLVDGAHLIKLSNSDMDTIRREYRPRENGKALAARFGVSLITIMRVIRGTQRVPKRLQRVPSIQLDVRGEVA